MSCVTSSGGYLVWEKVKSLGNSMRTRGKVDLDAINLLRLWMYFRLTSSLRTWATWSVEIFSRAERSWILGRIFSGSNKETERYSPNHGNPDRPRCIPDG